MTIFERLRRNSKKPRRKQKKPETAVTTIITTIIITTAMTARTVTAITTAMITTVITIPAAILQAAVIAITATIVVIAAMATARNSVGIEIDPNFKEHLFSRFGDVIDFSNKVIENRILNHMNFVNERVKSKGALGYTSKVYGFPVMTSQETEITFDELKKITEKDGLFEVEYRDKPTFQIADGALIQSDNSLKHWIGTS